MSDTIIKVENLSKKFCRTLKRSMYYGTIDTIRSMFSIPYATTQLRKDEFWALRNVSFELRKGERLGVIGVNGSGKTTLLRLLNGIFPPDEGKVTIKGRIGALIAVGAGFHPHMTGRENIYLNGTILGMPKQEIKRKFDDIVNFTGLEEFLDAPVSTYSSGMKVKLGFGVAIHSEADILLVDEVLSVGDIGFRNKSLRYMSQRLKNAKGIIYISHNLDQIQYLCDRVLVMDKGKILFNGSPHSAIRTYEQMVFFEKDNNHLKRGTSLQGGVKVKRVEIENSSLNGEKAFVNSEDPLIVRVISELLKDFKNCTPMFAIGTDDGTPICMFYGNEHELKNKNYTKGSYSFRIEIPPLHLREGKYYIHFGFRNTLTFETYEKQANVYEFYVKGKNLRQRVEYVLAPKAYCSYEKVELKGSSVEGSCKVIH